MVAFKFLSTLLCTLLAASSHAALTENGPLHSRQFIPQVTLDSGTFTGTTTGLVNKFLGIPYGQSTAPPNRFQLPIPVPEYTGSHDAALYGASCPQQVFVLNEILKALPREVEDLVLKTFYKPVDGITSEDCLFINVFTPIGVTPGSKLPVVVWLYGGAFEFGSSSQYDGSAVVSRSIELGQPIIYVSLNYRHSAWGFLASQEVKDAGVGNLGLRDQRLALKWVQKYITNFGGDPTKVTAWGESSGAMSVAIQMLINGGNTEGLFRSAILQSGAPLPVGDITKGQVHYDALVQNTGCSGSSDTLDCLRNVSADKLQSAVYRSPSAASNTTINLAWRPRVDGDFLTDNPQQLVLQGSVANIPVLTGVNDDDGTLLTLPRLDIITGAQAIEFLHTNFVPHANSSTLEQISAAYPDDITQGSPFDTGTLNAITPEFKRLSAIQNDLLFTGPRRFFIGQRADKQSFFTFLNKRLKFTPVLGTFHTTDLLQTHIAGELQDYIIHFVTGLNPNFGSILPNWPQYSNNSKQLLTLLDGPIPITTTTDTFREDPVNLVIQLSLEYPI